MREGSPLSTSGTLSLVFSDLDGSLLDHTTYSFAPALAALAKLSELEVPVVLASSKTCAEMESIRQTLNNQDPFIVENGAAVFLPQALFPDAPDEAHKRGEYWALETTEPRAHWLALIEDVGREFQNQYLGFSAAGTEGIARMTGLSATAASAANQRYYSEPLQWLGAEADKNRFIERLVSAGATVQQGGRFLSVSGLCDKGRALELVRALYKSKHENILAVNDIAIGDSQNDCAMLEIAKTALLIRSPAHEFPELKRTSGIIRTEATGPTGWAQGVMQWLDESKLLKK